MWNKRYMKKNSHRTDRKKSNQQEFVPSRKDIAIDMQ